MPNILALDLSTHCGYAYLEASLRLLGEWELCYNKKTEAKGIRYARFDDTLTQFLDSHPVDVVVYEEVQRHEGVIAAHVYGYLEASVQKFCALRNIPLVPVGVKVLKKFATGNGNAGKPLMIEAARTRFGWEPSQTLSKKGQLVTEDSDNMADAACLLEWLVDQLTNHGQTIDSLIGSAASPRVSRARKTRPDGDKPATPRRARSKRAAALLA